MAAMGGGEGRAKAGGMVGGQEKRRGVAPRSTSPGPAADLQPGALTRSPQRPSPLSPAPSSQVRRCGPSAIAHHARPAAHCFPSTNRPLPWPPRPALSPARLMPGSSFVPACPLSPPPATLARPQPVRPRCTPATPFAFSPVRPAVSSWLVPFLAGRRRGRWAARPSSLGRRPLPPEGAQDDAEIVCSRSLARALSLAPGNSHPELAKTVADRWVFSSLSLTSGHAESNCSQG